MKADAKTEAAVLAVLDKFAERYSKRDLDGVMALFAPDPDLVLIGTGADETRIGFDEARAQFERDWSQSDAVSMKLDPRSVSAGGSVAWIVADMTNRGVISGQDVTVGPLRVTTVLEQREGRWLIVQIHASAPMAEQPEGESWPTSIDAVVASVQAERPDLRPHVAPDGTVTILFTDIEGSAAMTERLGDLRWVEVLHEHNAIIRRQVAECGGFEVKAEGDGFMLAFRSARTALQCAIEMQRALAERNDGAEEPIKVRIGLHTGEAIKEGEDFFGKHVILAARVAGQAQGDEILVSSLLKELTESAGDVEFGKGREVELKGLAGSHRVYEVAW